MDGTSVSLNGKDLNTHLIRGRSEHVPLHNLIQVFNLKSNKLSPSNNGSEIRGAFAATDSYLRFKIHMHDYNQYTYRFIFYWTACQHQNWQSLRICKPYLQCIQAPSVCHSTEKNKKNSKRVRARD